MVSLKPEERVGYIDFLNVFSCLGVIFYITVIFSIHILPPLHGCKHYLFRFFFIGVFPFF